MKYTDPDGRTDWNMVSKGIENLYTGFGKIGTGSLILGASGAIEAFSVGTATPGVAMLGILGGGFVVNGFTQFVIGAGEVIAGFSSDEPKSASTVESIPNSMNEILGTTIDTTVASVTGEDSNVAIGVAQFIDGNIDIPSNSVIDIFMQSQPPLYEPTPWHFEIEKIKLAPVVEEE